MVLLDQIERHHEYIYAYGERNALAQKPQSSFFVNMSGIIIGIVAIICVMSIGEGAKQRVNKEIEKLGSNFIIVLSASQKRMSQRGHPGQPIFTPQDLATIRTEATDVDMVSPGMMAPFKVSAEGKSWDTNIGGVEDMYLDIRQWKLTSGNFFTSQDVKGQSKVAVIGVTRFK